MNSSTNFLLFAQQGPIATLTLNRPAVLNAINLPMAELLREHLAAAARDASTRAIIITGSGRGFCSGGDLRFALAANPAQPGDSFAALVPVLNACIEEICTMSKPVIAAINGPAAGAGLFLALACDLRVMAETAYLKQSNSSYGLSTPAGGSFFLPRLVGMGRALEIVMLDEPISASRARELGLVTAVHGDEALLPEAQTLAARVQEMPRDTLGQIKRLMHGSFSRTLSEHLQVEQEAVVASANAAEGREGLSAFVQKRRPNFAGANLNRSTHVEFAHFVS